MIDMEFPWTSREHSSRDTAELDCCMLSILFLESLSERQSSNAVRVVSGDSIPGVTPLREHWRHFHKQLKSQPVPLEGCAERTSLSSSRNRQCALPHCSADCPSPNRGVQSPIYTTTFSCRSNLRSIKFLNLILFSICVSKPSNMSRQIFLSLNLLTTEHENLIDSKVSRHKIVLNDVTSPLKKKSHAREKCIYVIQKELLQESIT